MPKLDWRARTSVIAVWAIAARTFPTTRCMRTKRVCCCWSYSSFVISSRLFSASCTVLASGKASSAWAPEKARMSSPSTSRAPITAGIHWVWPLRRISTRPITRLSSALAGADCARAGPTSASGIRAPRTIATASRSDPFVHRPGMAYSSSGSGVRRTASIGPRGLVCQGNRHGHGLRGCADPEQLVDHDGTGLALDRRLAESPNVQDVFGRHIRALADDDGRLGLVFLVERFYARRD